MILSSKSKRFSKSKCLELATCIIVLATEKVKYISFFAIFSINQRVSITTKNQKFLFYLPLNFCIVTHIPTNFRNHLLYSLVLTKIQQKFGCFLSNCNFYCCQLTVWKFHDFSVIQILREINFGGSRSSINASLGNFKGSEFV